MLGGLEHSTMKDKQAREIAAAARMAADIALEVAREAHRTADRAAAKSAATPPITTSRIITGTIDASTIAPPRIRIEEHMIERTDIQVEGGGLLNLRAILDGADSYVRKLADRDDRIEALEHDRELIDADIDAHKRALAAAEALIAQRDRELDRLRATVTDLTPTAGDKLRMNALGILGDHEGVTSDHWGKLLDMLQASRNTRDAHEARANAAERNLRDTSNELERLQELTRPANCRCTIEPIMHHGAETDREVTANYRIDEHGKIQELRRANPATISPAIRSLVDAHERNLEHEIALVARQVARDGFARTLRNGITISRKPRSLGHALAATVTTEDVHSALHLAKLVDGVRNDGGAVEIGGVKIERCDTHGMTEADHHAEKWLNMIGMFRGTVPASRAFKALGLNEPETGHVDR